ncbi:hypothetical protein LTR91_020258 [Friedmanniomyces endolithicus]|uniref:Uncharacterized protein n=1 Tax=Friedmanniomyces endolithicus TaxID=329885 RepID=A0AAN6HCF5_9PEZI|nr:hypothetical protein LTR57_005279 [Friedmanniomyces endolithicus]KAK0960638.1 hypothetical protein LTR91_020258 [Friedmanniomyces endolithicus]KAK1045835.1 hypothetical protein LTS16_006261 [Friedmanniomyces endolithicus]
MSSPTGSRVAIVTGASSGIGEALTRELINRGWFVAMADLRESTALTDEFGSKAKFYETDVASYDAQAKTFAVVFHSHGRIDALCANAGIGDRGSIYILNHRSKDEIPPAPDLKCTDVDWKGVLYGTQLAIHFMRKNPTPGGAIVATASIVAVHPHASYAEYNGTKAAVLNFVRGSAGVLKVKENIRINCVMPGIVDTAIVPRQMIAAVDPSEYVQSSLHTSTQSWPSHPSPPFVSAYLRLLDDESLTGQGIECSVDKQLPFTDPPLMNGKHTKRAATVWDPLFKIMHGENSGLADAIAGEDFAM